MTPFHLLPMIYQLKGLERKKAEIAVHNLWYWCGGTIPFTAEEVTKLVKDKYHHGYWDKRVSFTLDKVKGKTAQHNIAFFREMLYEIANPPAS